MHVPQNVFFFKIILFIKSEKTILPKSYFELPAGQKKESTKKSDDFRLLAIFAPQMAKNFFRVLLKMKKFPRERGIHSTYFDCL